MAEAPKKGRLTLYEDLLSKDTIAEMQARDAAKQAETAAAKKKKDASLMFKPANIGKKPGQAKAKTKPSFSAMHKLSSSMSATSTATQAPIVMESSPDKDMTDSVSEQPRPTQKRGFSDWLANDDEADFFYDRPQRERGGRKKKKKDRQQQEQTWSWDDIYDPTIPVPFQAYKRSDVEYDINDQWKRRLYDAHKREMRRQGKGTKRESSKDRTKGPAPNTALQFAPPVPHGMSFAPPEDFDPHASRPVSSNAYSSRSSSRHRNGSRDYDDEPRATFAPPPPPPVEINMEETAEEAYARRMALSQVTAAPAQPHASPPVHVPAPSVAPPSASPPVPIAPVASPASANDDQKAKIAAQIAAMKAKLGKPALPTSASDQTLATPPSLSRQASAQDVSTQQAPQRRPSTDVAFMSPPPQPPAEPAGPPGVISGAPTYNPDYLAQKMREVEGVSTETPVQMAEEVVEERTSRPGQAKFAERLMQKMGWEKGKGLGASGDGITTAIVMKADKRKKKSDSSGGSRSAPVNMGKIVGGKRAKPKTNADTEQSTPQEESNSLDEMSEVVKLVGMLNGLDVDHEIAENNLMQEIGDEMGESYGKVERLFIWRDHAGGENEVFVKFTSALSAVRCVKGMDGMEFAGNEVKARFWTADKFERGEYA